jgi:hypothetical protein
MVDISRRQALIGLGVLVVAFIAVAIRTPTPDIFLVDSDAGHQLAGAQQIGFGEHPFIDFRSTYGPLTFYASYAAQRIGGGTIAAELLLCALAYSAAFLLIFRCARVMGGTLIALACTALAAAQLPRFYKYYIFLGAALVMVCLLRYIRRPGQTRLAMLAGATAIAGLYRPDQGVYAFVSAVSAILIVERSAIRALVVLPGMIVVAASPWLIFLIARGGVKNYILDSTLGAARHAAGLSLPFPHLDFSQSLGAAGNLSAIGYCIWWSIPAIAVVVLLAGWGRLEPPTRRCAAVTTIFAALSLLQSAHRSDYGHLTEALAPCYVLLAFIAGAIVTSRSRAIWRGMTLGMLAAGIAICIWVGVVEHSFGQFNDRVLHDYTFFYAHRPAVYLRRLRTAYPGLPYLGAIDFIEEHTTQGQRFLAVPFMTTFYYLTGRPFAGGQMLMAPGYFSDEADQRRMTQTLARQGNPLIVEVADGGGYDGLPARKTRAFAAIFYQYVDAHYRKVSGPPLPPGMDAFLSSGR